MMAAHMTPAVLIELAFGKRMTPEHQPRGTRMNGKLGRMAALAFAHVDYSEQDIADLVCFVGAL